MIKEGPTARLCIAISPFSPIVGFFFSWKRKKWKKFVKVCMSVLIICSASLHFLLVEVKDKASLRRAALFITIKENLPTPEAII